MNSAEQYFYKQKESQEFLDIYNEISEQVDIQWELERVKTQIKNNIDKNIIITQLEKLQNFIQHSMFIEKPRELV